MDYDDRDEKYLNRCNKNKSAFTKIICSKCGEKFGMAFNIIGNAVSFKL
jgi:hypothetical protein